MTGIFDTVVELFESLATYIKAAVSALVSNKWLMIGSLILLFTLGKELKVGKLLQYKSK